MLLPNDAKVKDVIEQLQELTGINQKAELATVLGSPSVPTDTMPKLVGDLQARKITMATNLTAKGVVASPTETISLLATKIGQIKLASGNLDTPQSSKNAFKYRIHYDEDYRQMNDGGYVMYVKNRNGYSGVALLFYNQNGVLINTIPLSLPANYTAPRAQLFGDNELHIYQNNHSIRAYNFSGVLIRSISCPSIYSASAIIEDYGGNYQILGDKGDGIIVGFNILTPSGVWIQSLESIVGLTQFDVIRRIGRHLYVYNIGTRGAVLINKIDSKYDQISFNSNSSFNILITALSALGGR